MTQRIATLALALGAAAALSAPMAPAQAAGCSPTIVECINELLGSISRTPICEPLTHTCV